MIHSYYKGVMVVPMKLWKSASEMQEWTKEVEILQI